MSDLTQVEAMAQKIDEEISSMPQRVLDMILDNIDPTSHVGVSLRSDDAAALKAQLATLDMRDLAPYAERLVEASKALEHSDLAHTPHAEGLLRVIDGTASVAYESSDDHDAQVEAFYRGLQNVAPVIPGVQSDGSPLAMEKMYEKNPEKAYNGNSVLEMAYQELSNEQLDDETRDYWTTQIKKLVPELRDRSVIFPDDVPRDLEVNEAQEQAEEYNAGLGKASGQLLSTLYGSNRAEVKEPQSILTDTPEAPAPVEDPVADEAVTMDSLNFADPTDSTTPDFVDTVLPDGSVREA